MGSKKNDGESEESQPKKNRTLKQQRVRHPAYPFFLFCKFLRFCRGWTLFSLQRNGAVREARDKSVPV